MICGSFVYCWNWYDVGLFVAYVLRPFGILGLPDAGSSNII